MYSATRGGSKICTVPDSPLCCLPCPTDCVQKPGMTSDSAGQSLRPGYARARKSERSMVLTNPTGESRIGNVVLGELPLIPKRLLQKRYAHAVTQITVVFVTSKP